MGMRFLVIASVLAFVAAEPETFHHLGAHATAGYVKHMNGAVVPEDTASVKAAKGLHMAAKHNAALNGYAMPYVYQPLVKPVAPVVKPVEVEAPKVVSYKAPVVTYTNPVAAPITTYTHPIAHTTYATPYVYGAHHLIHKREAEAESDAQLLYTNAAYTTPYTYANPLVYSTPYTTYSVPKTYTYTTPYMTYGYPYVHHTIAKREAEGEANADAQYYYGSYYGAYPSTPYGYPYTYGAYPYNTYGYRYLY